MKIRSILSQSKSLALIMQFTLLVLCIQLLLGPGSIVPLNISASPLTQEDTIWENWPGGNNDDPTNAYDFSINGINYSITNPPTTPLNVSTWSPDYYNFTVLAGFYFQVFIEFNKTNVWNSTYNLPFNNPPYPEDPYAEEFYADIDLELYASNGTLLGKSKGRENEEAIEPIFTTKNETYMIYVSAVKPPIGYDITYSTVYNMSIVYDDEWELLQTNDDIDDLSDPRVGGCDDEIVPGIYEKLRFSRDINTEYGDADSYVIWFYQNSTVNITITCYTDPNTLQNTGLNKLALFDENKTHIESFADDDTISYDTHIFTTNYTGWYYITLDNGGGLTDYYSLQIDTEDAYEGKPPDGNNQNATAAVITAGEYLGMIVSEGRDDWYRIRVDNSERLMVEIHWLSFIGTLKLTLYNTSDHSTVGEAAPILNGLRVGPIRTFNMSGDYAWYFIRVAGDNEFSRYYDLTIVIAELDDWAEDNDNINDAYLLSSTSKSYEPTETDPFGGFFSLKNDPDWFVISLLPGDWFTARIEFNYVEGNLDMKLYDGYLNELDSSELTASNSETVIHRATKIDKYLFVIYGLPDSYATNGLFYNMTITIVELDDSFESNDDSSEADLNAPIAEGNYTDLILRDSDDDYYYLFLAENDFIEVSLTYFANEYEVEDEIDPLINDIDLILLFDDQSPANDSRNTEGNESFTFTAPSSGKYYIVGLIYAAIDGAANSYNLSIDIIETDDYHEDNDVFGEATRLTIVDTATKDTINYTETLQIRVKDDDYFVTKVPAGLAIIVSISQFGSVNLDLELLSLNGSILDYSTNDSGIPEQVGAFPMNFNYSTLYNGTDVYFRVFMDSGLSTSYFLNITIGLEELLIPRETVPPTKPKPPSKPFDPFTVLIPLVVGGAILGGGTAAGLYGAKKIGLVDKFKGRFSRKSGEKSGGTRKKPGD